MKQLPSKEVLIDRITLLEKKVDMMTTILYNMRLHEAQLSYNSNPSDFSYVPSSFRISRLGISEKAQSKPFSSFVTPSLVLLYNHSLYTTQLDQS